MWFASLFGQVPELDDTQRARLESWRRLPCADLGEALDKSRFVVVDVETSGLNLARDRLIAIGAVAVSHGRLDIDDSFEVVLRQEAASRHENILIHGIGGSIQTGGMPPAEALLAFLEYLGKSPLIAFHVAFDSTMLRGAIKQFLGFKFKHEWLDLAYVVPGLNPELAQRNRALDDWLSCFGIQNYARHNALADAMSTAQLFMVVARAAQRKHIHDYKGLQHLEQAQRWVSWQS